MDICDPQSHESNSNVAHNGNPETQQDHDRLEFEVCNTCQGNQQMCDCFLRKLMQDDYRMDDDTILCPAYLFHSPGNTDTTARLPDSWEDEIVVFAVEYLHRFSHGGWAEAPHPRLDDQHIYVDLLAGPHERDRFSKAPVLCESFHDSRPEKLPPGWRRVVNEYGRISYRHPQSGLAMHQPPHQSPRINQITGYPVDPTWELVSELESPTNAALVHGNWILDDPDASCQVVPTLYDLGICGFLVYLEGLNTRILRDEQDPINRPRYTGDQEYYHQWKRGDFNIKARCERTPPQSDPRGEVKFRVTEIL
jgi:hypothetical protein